MKSELTAKLNRRLFYEMMRNFLASSLILAAIIILCDTVFNDFLATVVSSIDRSLYYFFLGHKIEFFIVLFFIIVLYTVSRTLRKTTGYIEKLVDSVDTLFRKNELLIELPDDLKDVEMKLNEIKFESLRNERAAKEAEQRKNDLIIYLAHDLKTPLTSVIGYLTLLSDEKEISPELREKYLSIARGKAERLEELINEFFEITRFNLQNIALENSNINLSHMLLQLTDEFYPMLSEKALSIHADIAPNLTLYGDADKLARVFDNLLRNAISYSTAGTSIQVSAVRTEEDISITFSNEGPQIPEHQLNSIFEKFFRVDTARSSKTGGAGLGLAIAKQIVELHQGTISAVSNERITSFHVLLPIQH